MLGQGAELIIDCRKITANATKVVALCENKGIQVVGVVKACCGSPRVAKAFLAGGVKVIGDSRVMNLIKLRQGGITVPMMLLRPLLLSEIEETVQYADISINSEWTAIKALNAEAGRQGKTHRLILAVDVGDLREGILPEQVEEYIEKILTLNHIELIGLGTNLACYGGVVPDERNLGMLAGLNQIIAAKFGISLPWVSGGNSSSLMLVMDNSMPKAINQLRIGEGILLGKIPVIDQPIPGTYHDAFTLNAEIIETNVKPTVPVGQVGQDAFGRKPAFVNRGNRKRAILAIGKQDVIIEGLIPKDKGIEILGASSDHLILDTEESEIELRVGDKISFYLNYSGLLSTMSSGYVQKKFLNN